ncbi:MAG: hypothetical protein QNI95_07250 [Desulfobacterales bacterium]|nr:hypothetical protein [Desulfobacterales bacterium]
MRATRETALEPFGKPKMIKSIGKHKFVEGPAISADGNQLYYHQHDGWKFRLYQVIR